MDLYFRRKDIQSVLLDESHSQLKKCLNLFDLVCIGVGGTIGSGVFVLSGRISHVAGPMAVLSWLLAGIACSASAMSFAELSCRIPSAGSSYSFVYVTLGEYLAFISSFCLTLECGISGAAVARSWGFKIKNFFNNNNNRNQSKQIFETDNGINIFSGMLQSIVVLIILCRLNVGKLAINFFTVLKVLLIIFMIIAALSYSDAENNFDFAPSGVSGVLRGAASCLFGFVGYDEICCMISEAKNPQRDIPYAVYITIVLITLIFCLTSFALTGLQDYKQIDSQNGFEIAFKAKNLQWFERITFWGEIITIPLVVLVSFLGQPRIQYALSIDGLLPNFFSELDESKSLTKGTLFSGFFCVIIALFIPFRFLDEVISGGVLISFVLTNSSLFIIRRSDENSFHSCKKYLGFYVFVCVTISIATNYYFFNTEFQNENQYLSCTVVASFIILLTLLANHMANKFPEKNNISNINNNNSHFKVPCMPYVPLFGILINIYLLTQISLNSGLLLFFYFLLASFIYYFYSFKNSRLHCNANNANNNYYQFQ